LLYKKNGKNDTILKETEEEICVWEKTDIEGKERKKERKKFEDTSVFRFVPREIKLKLRSFVET